MPITAAILAGGSARRLGGRDKSALRVHGQTIFDRQIAALEGIAEHILLVGRASSDPRVRAVPDLVPGCGPLGGLHTALTEAPTDVVVVVACDMPFVSGPLLAHLASLTVDADAVVAVTDRGYEPLCAAYTRACLGPMARRLAQGHLKISDFLADVRLAAIPAADLDRFGGHRRVFANVNTPTDYDAALQGHEPQS